MVRQVCLDSDIIIQLLNKDETIKKILESLDAEFCTTTINTFEVWFGRKKEDPASELLSALHIHALESNATKLGADILRELKRTGQLIDMRDLFVGAICIEKKLELLTLNKKHFERLRKFGLVLV
ncbi:MAG: type II toxin-antitoxin system VapC family toxin [Candidatus Woesearchaeota archaeon]|nr:type II toxin-antitoxin system VapC family toxin [Candidatus Woesearchaeota archaeon]